ncbi:MAG: hypothetical protein O3A51_08495 [Verrucomicrobia bacterium]|nr:hypothetical protein [Verrucomicrobiota bacterium]
MSRLQAWIQRWRGANAPSAMPTIAIYPAVDNEVEFLDLYYKATYYLPMGSITALQIPITFEPSFDLANQAGFPRPDYNGDIPSGDRPDFKIDRAASLDLGSLLAVVDRVLVWDWSVLEGQGPLAESPKLRNIDRHHHGSDGWMWAGLLDESRTPREREAVQHQSQQRYGDLLDRLPRYDKAYVFGTGPSLETAYQYDFSDGYRVVCNTIVNNPAILDHIQPHLIVAGDAIYHFATNRHSTAFRQDLERELLRREMLFIMRDNFYPLFVHHHAAVADKTLVAATGHPGIHFNARDLLVYHQWPHGNILNALLLPLGSALSDDVYLLGIDGRAPDDSLFWTNSAPNSYAAYKPCIEAAHPGFYEKTDYLAYAQSQSDNAETLMQHGEQLGKRYQCLNRTFVPAFQKRQANPS